MKIATLIPAYKTQYIGDLLHSLRSQTVPPSLVVFSDDSPNGAFREVLYSSAFRPLLAGLNVEFHEGPRNGAYQNTKHLITLWAGRTELVHMLLDDDVAYPAFYQRHLEAHTSGDLSCSVSARWMANETGFPLQGQPVPEGLARHPNRMLALNHDALLGTTVTQMKNWLGELSNAVFRADCAEVLMHPQLGDVPYTGLWDLGAFVAASLRRPVCFIQDHLGFFRTSPGQNSAKVDSAIVKGAHLGWIGLALGAKRIGKLDAQAARQCYRAVLPNLAMRYAAQPDVAPFCELLPALIAGEPGAEERFIALWSDFLAHTRL